MGKVADVKIISINILIKGQCISLYFAVTQQIQIKITLLLSLKAIIILNNIYHINTGNNVHKVVIVGNRRGNYISKIIVA